MNWEAVVYLVGLGVYLAVAAIRDSIDIHRGTFGDDSPWIVDAILIGAVWPLVLAAGILFLPVYGCHRIIGHFVTKPQPKSKELEAAEQEVEEMLCGCDSD